MAKKYFCRHKTKKGERRVRCSRCELLGCKNCRSDGRKWCDDCVKDYGNLDDLPYEYHRRDEFERGGKVFRAGDIVKIAHDKSQHSNRERFKFRQYVVRKVTEPHTTIDGTELVDTEYVDLLGIRPRRAYGKIFTTNPDWIEHA